MNQKDWLIEFEKKLGINKPVFLDTRDTWEYPLEKLKWASELKNVPCIGRMRLDNELWSDIDNKNNNASFKELKEATLKLVDAHKWFGIPEECILIKSSGRRFHVQVFTEGIRDIDQRNQIMLAIFIKSGLPNSEKEHDKVGVDVPRLTSANQRIREFGAINGQHYCSLVTVDELKKLKAYPTIRNSDKVVYPEIKTFKVTNEFIRKVHEIETFVRISKQTEGEANYELDGDIQSLYKCPLINMLSQKAITERKLTHVERLFIGLTFSFFGEKGREEVHKIIGNCEDYSKEYTKKRIEEFMEYGYKPVTCDWAKQNQMCPSDCKGSGGRSPIKFGWTPPKLKDMYEVNKKWLCFETPFGAEDLEILDVIYALALDRKLEGDPVWLHFVAASGGTKTELIRSLKNWDVEMIDRLTEHTLVTGKTVKDEKTGKVRPIKGLLARLDGKILLIKDFTVILNMDQLARYEIFSQFRSAYDGCYSSAYGTLDEPIRLDIYFGLITGVTPVIDMHQNLAVMLGERFLKLRHEIDRVKATIKAMKNQGKEKEMRKELSTKTSQFFKSLNVEPKEVPSEIEDALVYLANFVAQMRQPVVTSAIWKLGADMGGDFETTPEYATRLVKQLKKLLMMLAIVRDKPKVDWEDYWTVMRVAFDTCPQNRLAVVLYLFENGAKEIAEIQKDLNWTYHKTERRLAELWSMWDVLEPVDELKTNVAELSVTMKEYMSKMMLSRVSPSVGLRRALFYIKHTKHTDSPTPDNGSRHGKRLSDFVA